MASSLAFLYLFLPAIEDLLDVVGEVIASGWRVFIFGSAWCGYVGRRCLTVKVFGGVGVCG